MTGCCNRTGEIPVAAPARSTYKKYFQAARDAGGLGFFLRKACQQRI
jgi:hypothetical protein